MNRKNWYNIGENYCGFFRAWSSFRHTVILTVGLFFAQN